MIVGYGTVVSVSRGQWRTGLEGKMVCDMTLVTSASHPTVFDAFELISHDAGNQAGHANYGVPLEYLPRLSEFEVKLGHFRRHLGYSKFEEFCIGNQAFREAMVKQFPDLEPVDKFLEAFFEEWGR